jgi:hypothetical protein
MRSIHRRIWTLRKTLVGPALLLGLWLAQPATGEIRSGVLLPDGQEFVSWEVPFQFTKTYYVDNRNPKASDQNPGTKQLPFLTINKAAQALQPGERVEIMEGVYRERVVPPRGGTGPEKIISYEAAGNLPDVETGQHFQRDLLGQPAGSKRKAGPFNQIPSSSRTVSVDPRQRGRARGGY